MQTETNRWRDRRDTLSGKRYNRREDRWRDREGKNVGKYIDGERGIATERPTSDRGEGVKKVRSTSHALQKGKTHPTACTYCSFQLLVLTSRTYCSYLQNQSSTRRRRRAYPACPRKKQTDSMVILGKKLYSSSPGTCCCSYPPNQSTTRGRARSDCLGKKTRDRRDYHLWLNHVLLVSVPQSARFAVPHREHKAPRSHEGGVAKAARHLRSKQKTRSGRKKNQRQLVTQDRKQNKIRGST